MGILCDGRAISGIVYADLFAKIGTRFGAGNGTTTFNVPDKRRKFTIGADSSNTAYDTPGKTGGAETVTLTTDTMPNHTTGSSGNQSADHTHSGTTGNESANHTHSGTTNSMNRHWAHNHTRGYDGQYGVPFSNYYGVGSGAGWGYMQNNANAGWFNILSDADTNHAAPC